MSEQTKGMELFIAYTSGTRMGRTFMYVPENKITKALIERLEHVIRGNVDRDIVIINIQEIAGE